jgi:hypothetical protein
MYDVAMSSVVMIPDGGQLAEILYVQNENRDG